MIILATIGAIALLLAIAKVYLAVMKSEDMIMVVGFFATIIIFITLMMSIIAGYIIIIASNY